MTRVKKDIATTRRELITALADLFPGNEAVSIARLILEHTGYSDDRILKDPSAEPDLQSRSEITKIVNELQKNRPIQYILGETEFFNLPFFVDERVLIPRPETEELVHHILLENKIPAPRILDIGTGSGCIAITLARNLPGSTVTAMDIEPGAIEVAKKNAARNNARIEFLNASILEPDAVKHNLRYDLVVSNPPYVTQADKLLMHPRVTAYEPGSALFVPDDDPLLFYRAIAVYGKSVLDEGGTVWVEINENFGMETGALFTGEGYRNTRLIKDIHGKDRFIKATHSLL
jgi:release factor glutamine methyltransferase